MTRGTRVTPLVASVKSSNGMTESKSIQNQPGPRFLHPKDKLLQIGRIFLHGMSNGSIHLVPVPLGLGLGVSITKVM